MKKYFIAGILVWAPMAVTIWVITWGLGLLDGVFGSVVQAIMAVLPRESAAELQRFRELPAVGILIVVAVVMFTGLIAINFAGQWWLKVWDKFVNRIPVVRSIYSSVQQVSSTLFSGSGQAFSKALLIRYPHPNSWAIAFQTGIPAKEVSSKLGEDYVNVFLPTTPNPTSGFFMIVPRAETIQLDMSVEEALKHIVSMGSVPPTSSTGLTSSQSPSHF
ncbi:DUF502 domain-containing protein [Polynucleobacter sphagniphilus]|jgi:uncharacterized membrane protein|uniref:Membrane protein n=1 Tax=Polynucleobacter sphagniphilus TaxID=1743169 RepID=A0AA43S5I0_9BURK|nr:DUF502 domain-containing protein [Polynucleobacter sphagniphilus]MDF9788603.1 putative membrane protein [Polynucleobacter sphagniphilus]MDH6241770.1 putative membrane protein [Polynucleobacter sphagniphilus]MDH6248797.1 putative membrane protein [Polynucleobacter sphagniphilus]MDH6299694.1 putative membrane protein [Polynucleobacter sphagniphilus]MDH6301343.1 putative membrane protein [Polynucleobacter sphagniphilus]